jgi:DNA polymerase-2
VLSIALYGCGVAEVLLHAPEGGEIPGGVLPFSTEKELLAGLCRRIREVDPDVLTGWNVIDFDLAVLARIAEGHGIPFELGRAPGPVRIQRAGFRGAASRATIPGRVVLDGIQLLRGAFVKTEDYTLDTVAHEILGEGKLISGGSRAHEILRLFEEDRARFVEYNLVDARLVTEILEKLRLVQLAVERSLLTGMPPDRVSSSIASFEFLYLTELGKRGIVAPTVRAETEAFEPMSGGHVLEPAPGLYRNVMAFDFRSLYPSVIRTFEIDPLGYVSDAASVADPIVAPNGAAFRRERGILPALLDDLVPARQAALASGDKVKSQAIKILMNSFYGVLGTPAYRFFNPEIANAITGFGKEILLWSKARIEGYGHRVLYGDTDSLFALSEKEDVAAARAVGTELAKRINRDLAEHLERTYRVSSRLSLQFQTLYLRLLLPQVRHGGAGARKRYAGLVEEGRTTEVVFTGMEVVRRDWTDLAKQIQRELYERLFSDRPVEEYLEQIVVDLRAGKLDDLLAYRKGIRKDLEEYTATTPPHIAAARKMTEDPGRVIAYVMTKDGPEPLSERKSALDHEHYVQKQVRPVAEPVLQLLGLEFDGVIGDPRQRRLF